MANDWDVLTLVGAFIGGAAMIAVVTMVVVRSVNPTLKTTDQALVLWFILCMCTF